MHRLNCALRPLAAPAGGERALGITPAQLDMPALESRFVLLSFAPAAVRAYAASLELTVAGGSGATDFKCEVSRCAGMHSLSCHVRHTPQLMCVEGHAMQTLLELLG